jgi:8-oxo-dGTP pyrophosphatase MutT (NUDIX family)
MRAPFNEQSHDVLDQQLQLAALPWRSLDGRFEVMLITSRLSGHWLIPKGWPMPGRTGSEAAAREAFEEAGVSGTTANRPIGSYFYDKLRPGRDSLACRVDVFPMKVEKEYSKWPEAGTRERRWVKLGEAAAMAYEPGLSRLLSTLDLETTISGALGHREERGHKPSAKRR